MKATSVLWPLFVCWLKFTIQTVGADICTGLNNGHIFNNIWRNIQMNTGILFWRHGSPCFLIGVEWPWTCRECTRTNPSFNIVEVIVDSANFRQTILNQFVSDQGVDRSDQQTESIYSCEHRSKKRYHVVCYFAINIALVNGLISHNLAHPEK